VDGLALSKGLLPGEPFENQGGFPCHPFDGEMPPNAFRSPAAERPTGALVDHQIREGFGELAIVAGMFVAGGVKARHLLVLCLAVYLIIALVFQFNLLHDYQMKRLAVFLNPEIDPLGSGYNLRQSMIAIGSGGIFGKGLFSGTQSRLDFLPPAVRHTDFIFAVIGEELGFIGGAAVIALLFVLLIRTLRVAVLSRNHFGMLIAAGIASMWLFQVLVNIGMTIGIMPITGIPLPFISYGGSSMVANMAAAGLLLSIYSRRWQ